MEKYINANPESGKRFYHDFNGKGKIVMLNLLKFRPKADYTNLDDIKPALEIKGKEAYQLYMEATLPELKKAGSRIIYYGQCKDFLIGPESEKWDAILIMEHQSVTKFMDLPKTKLI